MNKKGFTLIELLAVIAILAILMLLVTPRLVKSIKSSKKDTFYDNVTLIYNTAILEYVDDNTKNDEYCDTCSNNLGNKIPNKFEYDVKFEEDKLIYIRITDKEYIYVKSDKNGINKKDLSKDDVKEYDPNAPEEREEFKGGTLSKAIMYNNPTISTRTDFSTPFLDNTANTLYKTTENGTDVYYFAGQDTASTPINNWVKFGTYKETLIKYRGYLNSTTTIYYEEYSTMEECTSAKRYNVNCTEAKYFVSGSPIYWRIIRTNSDGSIRLLYSGVDPNTTDAYIGITKFNESYNSPKYVGYMYGSSDSSLDNIRANTNDSTIKTFIDNWYKTNLTSYTNYLSNNAIYCVNRELATRATYSSTKYFDFKAHEKLMTTKVPLYDCTNTKDAFSGNNTSAKLKYPIALMTADEAMFVGGKYTQEAPLWYITNSSYGSIMGSQTWWLISPDSWLGTSAEAYRVMGNNSSSPGSIGNSYVGGTSAVRPVISIKGCTLWKSGDGSASNPYEIQMNGGC